MNQQLVRLVQRTEQYTALLIDAATTSIEPVALVPMASRRAAHRVADNAQVHISDEEEEEEEDHIVLEMHSVLSKSLGIFTTTLYLLVSMLNFLTPLAWNNTP